MGLSFHLLCAPLGCKFVKFHPYTVDFSVANTSDPPVDINIHHVWVTFWEPMDFSVRTLRCTKSFLQIINHYTIHSTTLHYTTLHYTIHSTHYSALHYTTLHNTTTTTTELHNYTPLHSTTHRYTKLHYTTLHYTRKIDR